MKTSIRGIGQTLQGAWQQRSVRERRLLALAAALLGLALLWQLGVAPALTTWQGAAQRQAELDRQTRHMLQLQAEARQLQAPTRMPRLQAVALLENSAASLLGKDARLTVQDDVLRVNVVAAPAAGLAQWLAQAREKALALPQSARLERVPAALAATAPAPTTAAATSVATSVATEVFWRGELALRLP